MKNKTPFVIAAKIGTGPSTCLRVKGRRRELKTGDCFQGIEVKSGPANPASVSSLWKTYYIRDIQFGMHFVDK